MQLVNSKAVWRGLLYAGIACVALISALPAVRAVAADSFPFDEELLLDAKPMRGSKRIPSLDIRADGAVMIDLWCNSVQGQLVVADNTITVLTGQKTSQSCTPEREQGDANLLSALEQVTTWRRDGSGVVLMGPQNLRFYRATN
jgi:heat shock protein HslJ